MVSRVAMLASILFLVFMSSVSSAEQALQPSPGELEILGRCTGTSVILSAFYNGNFEQLEAVLHANAELKDTRARALLGLFGSVQKLEKEALYSRHGYFIAHYAYFKGKILGNCGKPQTKFGVTTTVTTRKRDGFGTILSEDTDKYEGKPVFIQNDFVPVFKEHLSNLHLDRKFAKGLRDFLYASSCSSPVITDIEKNMLRFYSTSCRSCSASKELVPKISGKCSEENIIERRKEKIRSWGNALE